MNKLWRPIGARLILKKVIEYEGQIVLAPTAKQSSMTCKVVIVGTNCANDYKPGDLVLIGRYSGYDVPVLDREYTDCIIVNEEDILCYEEKTNA